MGTVGRYPTVNLIGRSHILRRGRDAKRLVAQRDEVPLAPERFQLSALQHESCIRN
jgi:hypothetical protein